MRQSIVSVYVKEHNISGNKYDGKRQFKFYEDQHNFDFYRIEIPSRQFLFPSQIRRNTLNQLEYNGRARITLLWKFSGIRLAR